MRAEVESTQLQANSFCRAVIPVIGFAGTLTEVIVNRSEPVGRLQAASSNACPIASRQTVHQEHINHFARVARKQVEDKREDYGESRQSGRRLSVANK